MNRLCFSTPHLAAAVKCGPTQSVRKNFLTLFACLTVLATVLSSIPKPSREKTHGKPAAAEVQQLQQGAQVSSSGDNAPGPWSRGTAVSTRSGCQNYTSTSLTWRGSSVQQRRQGWLRRKRPGCCSDVKAQAIIDSYMLAGSSEGEICILVLPTRGKSRMVL